MVRAKVGSDLTSIAVQDGLDIRITVAVGPAVEVREHRRDEQRGADDHPGKTISRAEVCDDFRRSRRISRGLGRAEVAAVVRPEC